MSEIEDKANAMTAELMELLTAQNTPSWYAGQDGEPELRFDEEPTRGLDRHIDELEHNISKLVNDNPSTFAGKEQWSAYSTSRS